MKRIVMPGGSGYLGMRLAARLAARGDEVTVLTRGAERVDERGIRHVHWDGRTRGPWEAVLEGADAVVHLAGKRVDCRPTRANVDGFIRSRVESVSVVGEAVRACEHPPPVWVQCATLALFGDTGDQVLTEATVPDGLGPRQSTTVALAWEGAFHLATREVPRPVLLRIGVVLGDGDPAHDRLRRLVRLGLGGPIAGDLDLVDWRTQGIVGPQLSQQDVAVPGDDGAARVRDPSRADDTRADSRHLDRPRRGRGSERRIVVGAG